MKANVTEATEYKSYGMAETTCQSGRVPVDSRHESYFETQLPLSYGTGTLKLPGNGSISSEFAADLLGVNLECFENLLKEGKLKSHGNQLIGRFVNVGEFMKFKIAWDKRSSDALDNLVELGLQLDPDLNT